MLHDPDHWSRLYIIGRIHVEAITVRQPDHRTVAYGCVAVAYRN